jgi:hypothetical protein
MKKNKGRCRRERKESGWGNLGVWESWGDEKKHGMEGVGRRLRNFRKSHPRQRQRRRRACTKRGLSPFFQPWRHVTRAIGLPARHLTRDDDRR